MKLESGSLRRRVKIGTWNLNGEVRTNCRKKSNLEVMKSVKDFSSNWMMDQQFPLDFHSTEAMVEKKIRSRAKLNWTEYG